MEHKIITDPNIHEPKGASAASLDTVYVANGSGSGDWKAPPQQPVAFTETSIVTSASLVDQDPSGLDTALQVKFGAIAVSNSDISISTLGVISVQTTGTYFVTFSGRVQRDNGVGEARFMSRLLIDGVMTRYPEVYELADGNTTLPFSINLLLPLTVGMDLTLEVMRDSSSSSIDDGGLHAHTATLVGWHPAPSASVTISKLGIT